MTAVSLVLCTLTGCAEKTGEANIKKRMNDSDAYAKLMTYKTKNYSQQSIADFNTLLDDNYSEFSEVYETVVADILPDDENYDFVMLTLSASVSEIYFEHVEKSDEVGMISFVKKQTQPVKPLPGEEYILAADPIYDFNFYGSYYIYYTVPDPQLLTIAERDNALRTMRTEMQKYVDQLSEAEIMCGNIRRRLTEKAAELANSVSSDNIKLSCEIDSIEIYDAGTEIFR